MLYSIGIANIEHGKPIYIDTVKWADIGYADVSYNLAIGELLISDSLRAELTDLMDYIKSKSTFNPSHFAIILPDGCKTIYSMDGTVLLSNYTSSIYPTDVLVI